MRPRTAYISQRVFSHNGWKQAKDDDVDYRFNWNDFAVSQGTTLASVAYSTRAGGLTAASNSVSNGVASVKLTFDTIGRKNLKMVATMNDATTHTRNQLIEVYDPNEAINESTDIWGAP